MNSSAQPISSYAPQSCTKKSQIKKHNHDHKVQSDASKKEIYNLALYIT